jgi:hypothetical protein
MKYKILLLIAVFTSITGFAQDGNASAPTANQLVEIANRQHTRLQQYELQISALQEAVKALKAAKGSQIHITALEQLIQTQKQEFQTAKAAYQKTLAAARDIEVTGPKATDSQSQK